VDLAVADAGVSSWFIVAEDFAYETSVANQSAASAIPRLYRSPASRPNLWSTG
jgi:hypothetical protein